VAACSLLGLHVQRMPLARFAELLQAAGPTDRRARLLGRLVVARGALAARERHDHPTSARPALSPGHDRVAPGARRGPRRHLHRYSRIFVTTPAPTVLPPSRMAKRICSSSATGEMSEISMVMLSPGMTIFTPSGSMQVPVTSVVRM